MTPTDTIEVARIVCNAVMFLGFLAALAYINRSK
jgi:hypothetical protein